MRIGFQVKATDQRIFWTVLGVNNVNRQQQAEMSNAKVVSRDGIEPSTY
jgi:hypothetical protein